MNDSAPKTPLSSASEPTLQLVLADGGGTAQIVISGAWHIRTLCLDPDTVLSQIERGKFSSLELVASELGAWDSSLLAVVVRIVSLAQRLGIPCSTKALPPGLQNLLALALAVPPNAEARKKAVRNGLLKSLCALVMAVPSAGRNVLTFIGDIALSFGRLFTGRSACTGQNVLLQLQECGVEALPIVSLISLLVGFILAFVGVVQLSMFGAEIYVSSLVAIGMTRIMGAIMTGIIMSGRTGASFAAVIGTMQVNEEIDALTTQGISPSDFLVLPRVIALSLMTPLLVLYADLMGILGGFIVGVGMLGLDPVEYYTFTKTGFGLNNLWVGVAHGFVYGVVVAITGCYQGLRCGRSAAAVGHATTAAVVYSIVGIVISTAILTVLCNILGI